MRKRPSLETDLETLRGNPLVQVLVASAFVAIAGLYYVHGFVYTRTEALKLEARIEHSEAEISQNAREQSMRLQQVDSKYDGKLEEISKTTQQVQRDLGRVIEFIERESTPRRR